MRIWITIVTALILFSCSEDGKNVISSSDQKEMEILKEKIETLSEKTDPTMVKNVRKKDMHNLMLAYQDYANKFGDDPLAAEYYFSAANQAIGLEKYDHAIELFNKVFESYPDFDKRASCMMMMGLVFDQNLNNQDKARQAYEKVLEYFPDTEDAKNAEAMLQILGLTDEELIERFEKLNKK